MMPRSRNFPGSLAVGRSCRYPPAPLPWDNSLQGVTVQEIPLPYCHRLDCRADTPFFLRKKIPFFYPFMSSVKFSSIAGTGQDFGSGYTAGCPVFCAFSLPAKLHGFFAIKMGILGKYPFKRRIKKVVGTISTAEFPGRILQKTLRRRNNPGDIPSPGCDFPDKGWSFPSGGLPGAYVLSSLSGPRHPGTRVINPESPPGPLVPGAKARTRPSSFSCVKLFPGGNSSQSIRWNATRGLTVQGINLFKRAGLLILKNFLRIPPGTKRKDTHQDRDGIHSFFGKLPLDNPGAFPDYLRPDKAGFFKFLQPQRKDAGGKAGNGSPQLIEPVDLP